MNETSEIRYRVVHKLKIEYGDYFPFNLLLICRKTSNKQKESMTNIFHFSLSLLNSQFFTISNFVTFFLLFESKMQIELPCPCYQLDYQIHNFVNKIWFATFCNKTFSSKDVLKVFLLVLIFGGLYMEISTLNSIS